MPKTVKVINTLLLIINTLTACSAISFLAFDAE